MRVRENPVVKTLVVDAGISSSSGLALQSTFPSIVPIAMPHSPPGVRSTARPYHASTAARSPGDSDCAASTGVRMPHSRPTISSVRHQRGGMG